MTAQPTTPEQAAKIKRYFTERIASLNRSKNFYKDRLFEGSDPFDPETWDKIMEEHPESVMPYLTYRNFVEVFEMLDILSDSVIESEQNIVRLDENLKMIAKKNNVDVSTVMNDMQEIETDTEKFASSEVVKL